MLGSQKGLTAIPRIAVSLLVVLVVLFGFLLSTRHAQRAQRQQTQQQQLAPSETSVSPTVSVSPQGISNGHYGLHSFIFSNFSTATKTYLFDAAKRTGKTLIRFDFSLGSVEPNEGRFSWSRLDENVSMASQRGLSILGTLGYAAGWIAAPNAAKAFQGPIDPAKYDKYSEYVQETVRHFPQVLYWEIWNEPDAKMLYFNDPAGFAKILHITHDAIKAANPNAYVVFPGVIFGNEDWVRKVLTDPDNPGKNNYDIANVHIRGTIATVRRKATDALSLFRQYGNPNAPLWITEHGYPADTTAQKDPKYNYGEQAQADYYKESLPMLIGLGVEKIFVTLRDEGSDESGCSRTGGTSPFCTEGLVTLQSRSSTTGRDRPSMAIFQSL